MLNLKAVPGLPEVQPGDDLACVIREMMRQARLKLRAGDVLVIAQKIVSKAEGRIVDLATVEPGAEAVRLAAECEKDPRLVELVLRESTEVLRTVPGVIIVEHRLGLVLANAGIDQSNLRPGDEHGHALLLPEDPDRSARDIREQILHESGVDTPVIITDTFGRPWREGQVNFAVGVSGMDVSRDYRGEVDASGKVMAVTNIAEVDEIASAAELVMGKVDAVPAAIVRGHPYRRGEGGTGALLRSRSTDLFR